ncbi:hypothetical protein MPSEU_000708100 [Mayamaea pseudoterrestris]|nr:hypothetical protein MPSEU_000708100 [Mayamaea pseudoterrestris]
MSLAAHSGGGMGGGGMGAMAMAHQANMGQRGAGPPPKGADAGHGAPPPSAAVLGADLLDKQQMISLKQVKYLSHLPIVAVDLFAPEPTLATFPPKPVDPSESILPRLVGKMKAGVSLKISESSHKTLRKYLSNSRPYTALQTDTLCKASDKDSVTLESPFRWLGLRRLEDAPRFYDKPSCGADETGVELVNSTLDGSDPKGDDFDRVVYKVRLQQGKKAVAVLPEEAVQMLLHQAQMYTATKNKTDLADEEIFDYPCAVAIPAWASHDASIEALYDATSNTGVFFQRSVCALAGALQLAADGKPNSLLERLQVVREALGKEWKKRRAIDDNAPQNEQVLVILFGVTDDGFEATAIQVSHVQRSLTTCIFGNFKVLANVSYQDKDPMSRMEQCSTELEKAIDSVAPEADGPAALVSYGSREQQDKIKSAWDKIQKVQTEWSEVPFISTKSDAVAMGTAILGAVTHGRQSVLMDKGGKTKAELGVRIQNVSPCAVGVRINYHGDDESKWEPIKTIFDFDRRIPAGPYPIELVASECVVHRTGPASLSDEDFIKAIKENESAAHIPTREEAALNLRVEILQRWTRDGEWKRVADVMQPLVKMEGGEGEETRVACESITLELSVGVTGMLTSNLVGDRVSVVQATKSARSAKFYFYFWTGLAVLIIGGFLIRSYWEERVFDRDTTKLLNYYKHAIPGSIADGDERNARFIVWKYRSNKQKLWDHLEKKYGIPVLEPEQWEEYKSPVENEGDEENEDLDKKDIKREAGTVGDDDDEPGDEL